MVAFETHARWLLVVHAVLGAALVALTTHLAVWMRGYVRGRFDRQRGVRLLSWISTSLFLCTFALGNLIYPTYRVRVRAEYLESPEAVVKAQDARAVAGAALMARENRRRQLEQAAELSEPPSEAYRAESPRHVAKMARWFDVKEHWAAVGLAMSIALLFLLTGWDPRKHGARVASLIFAMAVGTAATTWLAALVGLMVTSHRAVGGGG